jgi:hypothetical protein
MPSPAVKEGKFLESHAFPCVRFSGNPAHKGN